MPEQANSISSGLSPVLKTANPGRADLPASAENAAKKDSVFSRELKQARQQQFGKTPAQRDSGKEDVRESAIGSKNSLSAATSGNASASVENRLSNDSLAEVSGVLDVNGRPAPDEVDESANSLLSTTVQPLTGELNKTNALANDSQPIATSSITNSEVTQRTAVAAPLFEQQKAVSTPVAPDAALERDTGTPKGTVGEVVTQATLVGRSRLLSSGLNATRSAEPVADDGLGTSAAVAAAQDLGANAGRLPKEQPLVVDLRKSTMEPGTTLANAATMSKVEVQIPGEIGKTVLSASEPMISGPAETASMSQANAVELTQLASGNGTVTQATLAGRLRHPSREVEALGAKTPVGSAQEGLTRAALPGLSTGRAERLAVGDRPTATLVNDSLSGEQSLTGDIDPNATVQQRIARTEAILSQMAQEAGDVAVKVPGADNKLLAVAGGIVTAPVVQHSESVAGPIVQAPLNINLASADAETALAGNVKWMTNEGVKNAVMTVTPHGMGPISVKIGIDGNQMDVSIIASQHSTRDALESMLPRLREQLAVQGHESVKVDVSDGKSEQSRSGNGQAFAESRNPPGASPQDNQSNSSNQGEKTEYGGSDPSKPDSESFMAEDLQRVATRVVGEAGSRPMFDAYV